jgi:hypothetical protein
MFKYFTFSIPLSFLFLITIHTANAMHGIEIQANPVIQISPNEPPTFEILSIKYPNAKSDIIKTHIDNQQKIHKSWQDLVFFTEQSIKNLQNGDENGIFLVHSLEDIMGAGSCFINKWNQKYLEDQRFCKEDFSDFHEVFSHEEYINHYIEFLMAERPLISGSIIALNSDHSHDFAPTFSPVNFILQVPAECIIETSLKDAGSPVYYMSERADHEQTLSTLREYITTKDRCSADRLIRFPDVSGSDNKYTKGMNEVAFLNVSQKNDQSFCTKIVAVLNNEWPGFVVDYGNSSRNKEWKEAAKKFAETNNLPYFDLQNKNKRFFSENEIKKNYTDYYGEKFNHYSLSSYICEMDQMSKEMQSFSLNDIQLEGYGLTRPLS